MRVRDLMPGLLALLFLAGVLTPPLHLTLEHHDHHHDDGDAGHPDPSGSSHTPHPSSDHALEPAVAAAARAPVQVDLALPLLRFDILPVVLARRSSDRQQEPPDIEAASPALRPRAPPPV